METAIIIISTDAQFVKYTINQLTDHSLSNIIERAISSSDFAILVDELIDENFRSFTIVLDENISNHEKIEIQDILFKHDKLIHYNFIYGLELVDDFE